MALSFKADEAGNCFYLLKDERLPEEVDALTWALSST